MVVAMESSSVSQGKLIMVCGAARSGTTMLDLMLGNADDAFSTGEIFAYFRPYRTHHFDAVCSDGDPESAVWDGLLDKPEREFHAAILARPQYNYVVDSSKDLRWVLDSNQWAYEQGIPCYNVVLYKDPIDLAHSYWKRGHDISWYRRVFIVYYERFLNLGLPFAAVNYNELAANPEATLEKICAYLGIPYDPRRVNFWEKRHHHFFGSAGTARQVEKGGSRVQNKRDFPQEFLDAYAGEAAWIDANPRFQRIIDALQANDIANIKPPQPQSAEPKAGLRPLWYYRHIVKSAFRRRFPERWPVAE